MLVILPTLNEELAIGPTLIEVNHFMKGLRCLVVDGRSVDNTVKCAKSKGAEIIFQKGLGKGNAIATAIEHVKEFEVEYIGLIDADFTYPAKYFPVMTEILDKNPDVGMVCGNRFNGNLKEMMPYQFYLGNRMLSFVHRVVYGIDLDDPLTGLRIIRRDILKEWSPKSTGFDIEVELNYFVKNKGFRIVEIPIEYRSRIGEKKLKFMDGFMILRRMILERFSVR